jgi:hypothetical protein
MDTSVAGTWLNLADRMGFVIRGPSPESKPKLHLPRAGVRDRIAVRASVTDRAAADLLIVAAPNQAHAATAALAAQVQLEVHDSLAVCTVGEWNVVVNFSSQKKQSPRADGLSTSTDLEPWQVAVLRRR